MNEEQTTSRWRRAITVERVLLCTVVVLQVGILWRLGGTRDLGSATEPVAPSPTVASAGSAPAERDASPDWMVVGGPLSPPTWVGRRTAWRRANLLDEMDAFVESAFRDFDAVNRLLARDRGWESAVISPAMDMREESEQYVVVFGLPGVDPDGIRVTLDGRLLSVIAATRGWGGGPSGRGVESRVQLPGEVGDAALASAMYTNGLLRVRVPKAGPAVGVHRVLRLM
jgi:HSP20 family molecular chaperone IbpA